VDLVATLLGDVRREHNRARRRHDRAVATPGGLMARLRQRGRPTSRKKRRNARS
jgi:hypothetical protein